VQQRIATTVFFTCAELVACVSLVAGCGGSLGAVAGPGGASSSSSAAESGTERGETPLVPSCVNLDFGIVSQGSRARRFFELRNTSGRSIELYRIETSCECLELHVDHGGILAGKTVMAAASLDLTHAADFTGQLAIEVKGLSRAETTQFSMTINVEVRSTKDFGALSLDVPRDDTKAEALLPTPMPLQ